MSRYSFISILVVFFSLCSCTKEEALLPSNNFLSKEETTKEFAIILSKAVYAEPSIRKFLKENAIKQFDYDYDVFYPWVKDLSVNGNQSFRDLLLKYDDKHQLPFIEESLPLLNILVPDWQWIHEDCFSINTWDTSINEVAVAYLGDDNRIKIFGNGTQYDDFPINSYPSFPVLVIKDNDRLTYKETPSTKGNHIDYSFISEAFNASCVATKAYSHELDTVIQFNVGNGYEYRSDISGYAYGGVTSPAFNAYSVAAANPGMTQRDYVYYGIDGSQNNGLINTSYHERLYRMKFTSININALWDSDEDYKPRAYVRDTDDPFTNQELQAMTWTDGALDLEFVVMAGPEWSDQKFASIPLERAFTLKSVQRWKGYNFFGSWTSWIYCVDRSDFIPKWFLPSINLFNWDIRLYPGRYQVKIMEIDPSISTEVTTTSTDNWLLNFTLEWGKTFKLGFNSGNSSMQQRQTTYHYTWQQDSDNLGSFTVFYSDPFVLSQPIFGAGNNTTPKIYSTGLVDMVVLPTIN